VVALRFEYFGDPRPPQLTRPATDPHGAWTTNGPSPPAPDVDDMSNTWPEGENCVFDVDAVTRIQSARLPDLGGASGPDDLAALTPGAMIDGPWCPDETTPNRFDADLLRVRLIRVTLRVQTARATLRGLADRCSARWHRTGGRPRRARSRGAV
jgi:hypothetical protein